MNALEIILVIVIALLLILRICEFQRELRSVRRYDDNGVPIVLLEHIYYSNKRLGLSKLINAMNFKRIYSNRDDLCKDLEMLKNLGFVEEVLDSGGGDNA